jgi:hypothetical protein
MSAQPNVDAGQEDTGRPVQLILQSGIKVICACSKDAEMVQDAAKFCYESEPGHKLTHETLVALERAGLRHSRPYRAVMHYLEGRR